MRRSSRILMFAASGICLYEILSTIALAAFLFSGGFITGMTLLSVALNDSSMIYFTAIGVPIMGGLTLLSLLVVVCVIPSFILMIIAILGGTRKQNKGKVIYIICLVFSILALINGFSTASGIIILIASALGLGALKEEKEKLQEKEEITEVK